MMMRGMMMARMPSLKPLTISAGLAPTSFPYPVFLAWKAVMAPS